MAGTKKVRKPKSQVESRQEPEFDRTYPTLASLPRQPTHRLIRLFSRGNLREKCHRNGRSIA